MNGITHTGNDAIFDILLSERFHGVMSSISMLTEFIDQYFTIFISVTSFFIISAALLRNVIAGAYAAFPKFWDKVADAKVAMQGRSMNIGGTDVSFMMKIMAFFVPNLKELSDFHDNTVEPKHYFIVAIPQMFAVVMIGVMIYNGYYRDVTAVTAQFGSAVIEKVLFNVHPVDIIDKAITNAFKPEMASSIDNSDIGENVNKISNSIYKEVIALATDMTDKGTKTKVASQIESAVYNYVNQYPELFDSENYEVGFKVIRALGSQSAAVRNMEQNNTEAYIAHGFEIDYQTLETGSQLPSKTEGWIISVITTHEKKATKVDYVGAMHDLTLTLKAGSSVEPGKITLSAKFSGQSVIIDGKQYGVDGGALVPVSTLDTVDFNSNGNEYRISGELFYTTSDGVKHKVSLIKIDASLQTRGRLQSLSRPNMVVEGLEGDFPDGSEE